MTQPDPKPDPKSDPRSAPLTYGDYLKVPQLLSLQQCRSDGPEHDEMLFIVIHQVYELWFKQQLWEGDRLCRELEAGHRSNALAVLDRMLTILKTMVAQIDVLETMTPVSFQSFRARLESASGFQSAQFREFEFLLGAKRRSAVEHYPEGSDERERLARRFGAPTIWDAFLRYLATSGIEVPKEALERAVESPIEPCPALQPALIALYHADPDARSVAERLVDLDEGVQEWRYRHVKMVERTIGFKHGTGGSSGAGYLRETLFRPAFPDLWAIRTDL